MKQIGETNNNVQYKKYKQQEYVVAKRKNNKWFFGKFRWRTKARATPKTRYKIVVKLKVTATKKGALVKSGIYTGTSHILSYYSRRGVNKQIKNAINQAKAYAIQDMYQVYVDGSDDYLIYKILSVKTLRLKYRSKK